MNCGVVWDADSVGSAATGRASSLSAEGAAAGGLLIADLSTLSVSLAPDDTCGELKGVDSSAVTEVARSGAASAEAVGVWSVACSGRVLGSGALWLPEAPPTGISVHA
eukprot:TRINITY_DN22729_c0_g1_i1.p2 TRINITY_DN22729_c0_g1~~TRINITY_DN22729_c0_g1_i1.p2  ORF type:complete len:108 (-),score=9.15 TRINITY_DN22729_c0_g1_i1:477-800(-)